MNKLSIDRFDSSIPLLEIINTTEMKREWVHDAIFYTVSLRPQMMSPVRRTPCTLAGPLWRQATPSTAAQPWWWSPPAMESTASCSTQLVHCWRLCISHQSFFAEVVNNIFCFLLIRHLANLSWLIGMWRSRSEARFTAWMKVTQSTLTPLSQSTCRRRSSLR